MARSLRALRWLLLAAAAVLLVVTTGEFLVALVGRKAAQAVDLIPLWCRARALAGSPGGCDPAVMAEVFHHPVAPAPVGSSPYYYPPTAALLFLPLAALSFDVAAPVFRALSVVALGVGVASVVFAVPPRDRVLAGAAALALLAGTFALRVSRGSLVAGQTGPLMVGLTALALGALGRGRERVGGAVAAVGMAVKLFPILLVPAAVRRPRWLVSAAVVGLVLAGVAIAATPATPGESWWAGAAEFVDRPMRGAWVQNEAPWVLALWRARFWAVGVPAVLAAAWHVRRLRTAEQDVALAALFVAWGGTIMAGSPQSHEAIVLLPAVGWVLAWPVQRGPLALATPVSAGLLAALVAFGVASTRAAPNSLHWVPLGTLTAAACLLRWGVALRERAPTTPPPTSPAAPPGTVAPPRS